MGQAQLLFGEGRKVGGENDAAGRSGPVDGVEGTIILRNVGIDRGNTGNAG